MQGTPSVFFSVMKWEFLAHPKICGSMKKVSQEFSHHSKQFPNGTVSPLNSYLMCLHYIVTANYRLIARIKGLLFGNILLSCKWVYYVLGVTYYLWAIFISNKKLASGLNILSHKNRNVIIVKCEIFQPDWALCSIDVKPLVSKSYLLNSQIKLGVTPVISCLEICENFRLTFVNRVNC